MVIILIVPNIEAKKPKKDNLNSKGSLKLKKVHQEGSDESIKIHHTQHDVKDNPHGIDADFKRYEEALDELDLVLSKSKKAKAKAKAKLDVVGSDKNQGLEHMEKNPDSISHLKKKKKEHHDSVKEENSKKDVKSSEGSENMNIDKTKKDEGEGVHFSKVSFNLKKHDKKEGHISQEDHESSKKHTKSAKDSKKDKKNSGSKRKNVLLMIVDDMRPEATPFLSKFRRPWLYSGMRTPNFDRLSNRSMVFMRAYAQQARCNPSRSSFLTGRRADSTLVENNDLDFRTTTNSHMTTLPEFFKNNGYTTASIGKVFHTTETIGPDDEYSWSVPSSHYFPEYNTRERRSTYPVPDDEIQTMPLMDMQTKDKSLYYLKKFASEYREENKPFFLAVGFRKPHLPFTLPKKFLEMYAECDDIKPAEYNHCPKYYPEMIWNSKIELFGYEDILEKYTPKWTASSTLNASTAENLRRGYYGCVSYIDSLAGEVFNKMDSLDLWDDTVVVLMSDHGWHLGENNMWGKNTNMEAGLQVPLMVSIPGLTESPTKSYKLVELVDLYPTLVEATGFEVPKYCPRGGSGNVTLCMEGTSLISLMKGKDTHEWKDRVFSQSIYPIFGPVQYSGYTMRTIRYRYTEWIPYIKGVPEEWPKPVAAELYDLINDPNQTVNKVYDKDFSDVVTRLSSWLHDGWTAALEKSK